MESSDDKELYDVKVTMQITKKGKIVEMKNMELNNLNEAYVRGLADLFSMLAANTEYLKKLTPQFEKLDKSKPSYLR
ncbi:MAG: hypothetical protein JRN52_09035 [Nitrososphaerota archaeon]|nr:hypothetical protein [Nitrososphaerota archaeon]